MDTHAIKMGMPNTSAFSAGIPAGVSASEAFSQQSVTDLSALQNLKALGKTDQGKAIEQVAKQFESIFIQQMLKSMRQAGDVLSKGGLFDSNEMKFHRDMLDQQLGLSMTQGKGLGLAESITRQLKRQYGLDKADGDIKPLRAELGKGKPVNETKAFDINGIERLPVNAKLFTPNNAQPDTTAKKDAAHDCTVEDHLQEKASKLVRPSTLEQKSSDNRVSDLSAIERNYDIHNHGSRNYVERIENDPSNGITEAQAPKTPAEFVAQMLPYAKKAAEALGVDYKVLLAQSALESGWGKAKNGNNLFGIKATASWQGEKNSVETTEYVQGKLERPIEDFRSYNSHHASFMDYANLIKGASRYDAAVGEQDPEKYISALHSAGYATDPNYVKKVMSVYHSESMRHAIAHAGHKGVVND